MIDRRNNLTFNKKTKNKEIRNRPQVPAGLCTYVSQYVLAMRHGHLAGASLVTEVDSPRNFFGTRTRVLVPGNLWYQDPGCPIGI